MSASSVNLPAEHFPVYGISEAVTRQHHKNVANQRRHQLTMLKRKSRLPQKTYIKLDTRIPDH